MATHPVTIITTVLTLMLLQGNESVQSPSYRLFGTKTAYFFNDSAPALKIPNACDAVHINMVIRHGSRYPSDGDMEEIQELLTKLHTIHTSNSPFRYANLIIPWKTPSEWQHVTPSELSSVGEIEQYNIAKRYRSRFPGIFDKPYWNKYFRFVSTDKSRTVQSAVSFAHGIFEGKGPVGDSNFQPVAITYSGPEEKDDLLSPDDACPRYETEVDDLAGDEADKFLKSSDMINVTKRLEQRLQIAGELSLTKDDVEKIFRLCAFGVMNRGDNSWCPLLDPKDMAAIEYLDDLENYYEHSYGIEFSYKIICVLVKHITQNLRDFAAGKAEHYGIFRFSSSGTVTPLLAMLGLFKDSVPLRADNFRQQGERQFRMSNMVPMSANVAFVLYKCNSTEDQFEVEYKVQVLLNEELVGLPCCQGNKTCSLENFLLCFDEDVKNCDFEAMCALPSVKPSDAVPIFAVCFELPIFMVLSLQLLW